MDDVEHMPFAVARLQEKPQSRRLLSLRNDAIIVVSNQRPTGPQIFPG